MRILGTIIWLFICMSASANFNPPVMVDSEWQEDNISSYVAHYGDVSCSLSMNDILNEWEEGNFVTILNKANIGYTQVCHWMQFQLINVSEMEEIVYVDIANPRLDDVRIHVFNERLEPIKYTATGNAYPFSEREVGHRNFLIELTLEPDEMYSVFIQVGQQPNYVSVPIRVWNKSHKLEFNQRNEYRLGMFYGIMLLYVFIMALMSYFLNDAYYLYYTLLLSCGVFFIFINEGLGVQFLWPNNPRFDDVLRFLLMNAYLLVASLFVENFIRDKLESRTALYFLRGGIVFLAILSISIIFYPSRGMLMQYSISIVFSIVMILVHIMLLGILFLSYRKSREVGLIFFLGAFFISFGIIIFFTLVKFGLLPVNIDGSSAIYIGGSIVAIIFTLLFGYRVGDVIRRNKVLRTELGLAGTKYSYALLQGQEKERHRVADELHDGIGIKMSALKMKLSGIPQSLDETSRQMLQELITHVDSSCSSVRSMSHSLVPRNLERYGLLIAISDLVQELRATHRMKIIFRQKRLAEEIDQISKLALYRLVEGVLVELARRKVEQVTLRLVIIPSIKQASINFQYIGRRVEFGINRNLTNVRSIVQVLNGQVRWTMDTMWSNQVDIDIPVMPLAANGDEE